MTDNDSELSGVLLVGGLSRRFGSPKALARFCGEPLAERAWRLLGEMCAERIAVGKHVDGLSLPFPIVDDGSDVRAALAGIVAGLRVATRQTVVMLPVDCPLLRGEDLLALAASCRDVAVTQIGPLPGVYRRTVLPQLVQRLDANQLTLRDALAGLDTRTVWIDPRRLANVNTPEELEQLVRAGVGSSGQVP
jgi:molybdopterin-guanine dinucleotide biosynthesis protein A